MKKTLEERIKYLRNIIDDKYEDLHVKARARNKLDRLEELYDDLFGY